MPQSKDTHPGHPVTKQTIASDKLSATGCGPATKGHGRGISTTSGALNRGEGTGYGVGSMGSGRPRPVSEKD
jgi:hypothetical protein